MPHVVLPPFPMHFFIIPVLGLPACGLIAFLQNHPLSARVSALIRSRSTASTSCISSPSVRQIVNARDHVAFTNSFSIRIPKDQLHGFSDEQIVARLTKGFFEGIVFSPQRVFVQLLEKLGKKTTPVGFSSIPEPGPAVQEIPKSELLAPQSSLINGKFLVLDAKTAPPQPLSADSSQTPTYIDIGFGNDRKSLVGVHRFEVSREAPAEKGEPDVTICFSSLLCNPTVNKPVFPGFVHSCHKWYAEHLFRDGIREVLFPV